MEEEIIPCPNISIIAALAAWEDPPLNPIKIKVMWFTLERAIRTFKSFWFMQIPPMYLAAIRESLQRRNRAKLFHEIVDINRSPIPPIFRRSLAKTIEPKTGASTWALGSHIWSNKTGILIRNTIIASA